MVIAIVTAIVMVIVFVIVMVTVIVRVLVMVFVIAMHLAQGPLQQTAVCGADAGIRLPDSWSQVAVSAGACLPHAHPPADPPPQVAPVAGGGAQPPPPHPPATVSRGLALRFGRSTRHLVWGSGG